jgi:hypothetical protein
VVQLPVEARDGVASSDRSETVDAATEVGFEGMTLAGERVSGAN